MKREAASSPRAGRQAPFSAETSCHQSPASSPSQLAVCLPLPCTAQKDYFTSSANIIPLLTGVGGPLTLGGETDPAPRAHMTRSGLTNRPAGLRSRCVFLAHGQTCLVHRMSAMRFAQAIQPAPFSSLRGHCIITTGPRE